MTPLVPAFTAMVLILLAIGQRSEYGKLHKDEIWWAFWLGDRHFSPRGRVLIWAARVLVVIAILWGVVG